MPPLVAQDQEVMEVLQAVYQMVFLRIPQVRLLLLLVRSHNIRYMDLTTDWYDTGQLLEDPCLIL